MVLLAARWLYATVSVTLHPLVTRGADLSTRYLPRYRSNCYTLDEPQTDSTVDAIARGSLTLDSNGSVFCEVIFK